MSPNPKTTTRRIRGAAGPWPVLPVFVAFALALASSSCGGGSNGGSPAEGPWGGAALIQPAELAAVLADSAAAKPVLLHVGVRVLYRAGAIPGSRYVGPGSDARARQAMLDAVAAEPKDREIVIYCGCCPAVNCPNMKPAFAAMREAGYTNVKALWIEKDFDRDWADHGYPTVKPES